MQGGQGLHRGKQFCAEVWNSTSALTQTADKVWRLLQQGDMEQSRELARRCLNMCSSALGAERDNGASMNEVTKSCEVVK